MDTFELFKKDIIAEILIESSSLKGVELVTNIMADDIELVTGLRPKIRHKITDCSGDNVIIVATINNSNLLGILKKNNQINLSNLENKKEVYLIEHLKKPFESNPKVKNALLILGSDKRGTIYGMFHLSEMCGISPMIFWGDVKPHHKDEVLISLDSKILSKEPSVKYRGFFINDEWPAFGKWCFEKYGGVNALAYEKVFEFLLRMKGNYLWPAMWNSSFWEDGPGLQNAELANELGIIMGTSHHEPLSRAGVEWQNQYKQYSEDSSWNFIKNKEAISHFWKDGLERSKDFENIITIGMRGENDSKLLGEEASLKDNIEVVKDAIITQNQIIKSIINKELKEIPRMLAIYKEVEDFYFGDNNFSGLRGWSEIDNVILLLSDDNHGNLRSIPALTNSPHPGGYGIYYHFDYHGAPISYEWVNCTNLVKVWEQLTMAYEYGIREMWIVNVGDIKGNEYPLNYFMELAYDFEKWGTNVTNSAELFTRKWIDSQFGTLLNIDQKEMITDILNGYTKWNAIRTPETLNEDVYQNNLHECSRVFEEVNTLLRKAEHLRTQIPDICLSAYDSMIYYPAVASLNLILMHIEASLNHILAERGSLAANQYIESIKKRILCDEKYVKEFHSLFNGKWNHMMESAHTGFRTWDDNNWTYPTIQEVMPIPTSKIIVSFRGDSSYNLGEHWQDIHPIVNSEFTRPDINKIILDIDSRGSVDFHYEIKCEKPWLSFSKISGDVKTKESGRTSIVISCNHSLLSNEEYAEIIILFNFNNGDKKHAKVAIKAGTPNIEQYHGLFLESQDYICIEAEHFENKFDIDEKGWRVVKHLGNNGSAIKSFPITANWLLNEEKPFVQYSFIAREEEGYILSFYLSPRNPMQKGNNIKCCYSINHNNIQLLNSVSENYYTEWYDEEWNFGVMNNLRIVTTTVNLNKGKNTLKFYATEPNIILEQIVLYPASKKLPKLQLAPLESYQIP